MTAHKRKPGRPKGYPKTGGRKKGVRNKDTATLRCMILAALDKAGGKGGGVAYLAKQAEEHPKEFLALLARILPTQVTGANDEPISTSWSIEFIPAVPQKKPQLIENKKDSNIIEISA